MVHPVSLTNWALGVSLALLSSFLSSLGLTLQRLSTLRELARKEESLQSHSEAASSRELHLETPDQKDRRCQPLWLVGLALYMLAAVPDVASYILVPQVVCSAVACFRLVMVTIMSASLLGEKPSCWQTLGMLVCTLGTLICVCFGPVRMGRESFSIHFTQPQVTFYMIIAGSVMLVLFVFDHLDSIFTKCVLSARFRTFTLPLITGSAFAVSKVFNTELGFLPVPNNILLEPRWMFMAIALVLLGLTDLYLNLRATRLMAVHVFIPTAFVWAISLQYFQSVVLFSELSGLSMAKVILSSGGACLSLVGAIVLQIPQKAEAAGQEQDKSDLIESAPSQCGVDLQDHISKMLLDC